MAEAPRLLVDRFGRGEEPVLLLHGLGGTSSAWLPQAMALAATHRFIAPELAGAGRSPLPDAPLTAATHLADIIAVLDAEGLDRVHVAGHSFGALLALHLAAMVPQRVTSLILAGGFAAPTPQQVSGMRDRARLVREQGLARVAETLLPHVLAPEAPIQNPAAVAFVRQSYLAQTDAGYAANCEALAASPGVDLTRVACPVLALTGDADKSTPVEVMRAFTSQLPGAVTCMVLPGCGHWPQIERARQVSYQVARHTAVLRRPTAMVWRPEA